MSVTPFTQVLDGWSEHIVHTLFSISPNYEVLQSHLTSQDLPYGMTTSEIPVTDNLDPFQLDGSECMLQAHLIPPPRSVFFGLAADKRLRFLLAYALIKIMANEVPLTAQHKQARTQGIPEVALAVGVTQATHLPPLQLFAISVSAPKHKQRSQSPGVHQGKMKDTFLDTNESHPGGYICSSHQSHSSKEGPNFLVIDICHGL